MQHTTMNTDTHFLLAHLDRTSKTCIIDLVSSSSRPNTQQATRGYASQAAVRAPRQLEGLAGTFVASHLTYIIVWT